MPNVRPTTPGLGDVMVYGGQWYENQMSGYQQTGAPTEVGSDIVTGGDFAADTGFTKGTGWTIAAGVADSDASQSADSDLTQTPTTALVEGKTYEVTFTTANRTAGNLTAVVGSTEGTDRTGNTTYVENIAAGSGADLDLRADSTWDGDVDDWIVKLANITWDMRTYQFATVTLTGNRVMDNPAEHVAGAQYTIQVTQDGTGSRLISWGSDFDFAGGTAPTLSTGAADIDIIIFQSNGSKLRMIDAILNVS